MNTIQTSSVISLGDCIPKPSYEAAPIGKFKYASLDWSCNYLKEFPELLDLINFMCDGIQEPRVTYWHEVLGVGECFGHGQLHCDGYGTPDEIHRLITYEGEPTIGWDGSVLTSGYVWQFNGDYKHKSQRATEYCDRLMLRVSKTAMPYRNRFGVI